MAVEQRSLEEVELGCTPSEEYLRPGAGVALDGLLEEEGGAEVRNAAVEA